MRFPNVYDICSKNILTINYDETLQAAVDKMLSFNACNIFIVGEHYYHVLRAKEVMFFKLKQLPLDTLLSDLELPRLPMVNKADNILDCVVYLKDELDQVGIADDEGNLCGILAHGDIVNSIDPEVLIENYSISDVLKRNRGDIWVKPLDKTKDVVSRMAKHNADCVIAKEGKSLQGIFTTKDVMSLFDKQCDLERPIADFMSSPVETVYSDTSIKASLLFIQEKHFKRVVVVDRDGELQGIVAQSELISLTYNNWAVIMKKFHNELQEINSLLESKSKHYEGLAAKDPLTNLYNRYKFTEVFKSEFSNMNERVNGMSLIMLDIDFFKKINDKYGHNIGDDVLKKVALELQENQRETDVICRWGGEEFLILLPSASIEKTQFVAEKLRNRIKQINDLKGHSISASFGVTQVKTDDTLESLVERADAALYKAKKNGRDQVVSL